MGNCFRKDNSDLDLGDGNQISIDNQNQDQKDYPLLVKIEAEMRNCEDFPCLKFHSTVFMENNLVLFGGKNSNGKRNNELYIFNLETRTWSQKELKGESNQIPKSSDCHTANAIDNFIFIIGGYGVGEDKNIYKIDFDTQKCQIIGKIIEPVFSHITEIHNQNVYIFGGQNQNTYKETSILQKFNLLTNECEEIKPIGYQPKARQGHNSIIVQENLYIFGGFLVPSYLQDMFSINLSSNVSTVIEQHGLIPSPRSYFSFFAFEDKLYLFGGMSGNDYYQDFYSFDLKSSSWKAQPTKNQECLLKRTYNSTVAVKESSHKLKVYLVGGTENFNSFQKNMNVVTLTYNRTYCILHYLESTGIQSLIGLNMVQEIIELFE